MGPEKKRTDMRFWLADLTHTGIDGRSLGVDTFPLAIGCLATYAESRIAFKEPVRLFRYPHKLAAAIDADGCPHVIGFSNFVWNMELALAVARRIKEMAPRTVVVMGGPNFPLEPDKQEAFLRAHPEIDFYVVHEGEVPLVHLLNTLIDQGMDAALVKRGMGMPSVLWVDGDGVFRPAAGRAERLKDLDQIPSPYVAGKFDEFFDGRLWPLIHTNRGCPFTCTYCTEGNAYYCAVAKFSSGHVREEIEYIGRKMAVVRAGGGRSDVYIGDSNFGMYEEDVEAAKMLARSYTEHGWPDHINTSTGKNQKQRILEVARIVEGRIVLSGSVQSLDPVVLANIKRKNISVDELMLLAQEARNTDANSYCEVILGLPGETRASHFQTLRTVVEAGFNKVIPYQLMILAGSELGTSATVARYGMEVRSRVLPRAFGVYTVGGKKLVVADIEDICAVAKAMSFDDYVACRTMHLVITIFYNDIVFGTVLKALRHNGLSAFRWLELILESIPGTVFEELFNDFCRHTRTELWDDRQALEKFIQAPGTIERYAKGEIGFNLLYTFKAQALVAYPQAMADAACTALKHLLEESGVAVQVGDLLNEAIRWDVARITGIIKDLDVPVAGAFAYDVERFAADENPSGAQAYALQRPLAWRFELNEEQKDYVRRNLRVFGDDLAGIGRVLSNAHIKQLLRRPVSQQGERT